MKLTLLLLAVFTDNTLSYPPTPTVRLLNGAISGLYKTTFENVSYYSFEKIPYAAPPTGNLRFQSPKPPQNWTGTLNCHDLDVICHQDTYITDHQSEDCLYLNVYTPLLPKKNLNNSLPVMFYIHGGGFVDGSAKPYNPDLFMRKSVVLVTINYRLGPYGFLSTQDHTIPGNNGLKDQVMALKWVHSNIGLFSGNPDKVTIFGHSAGAASVGYHLLNRKESLFWAAICQSGSSLGPWAYQRKPRRVAFKMAAFLNDTFTKSDNSGELLRFLQSVEAEDINRGAHLYRKFVFNGSSEDIAALEGDFWAPTLELPSEEAVLTEKMYTQLVKGDFVKVPLLTGFTTEENLNFHLDPNELESTMKMYDSNVSNLVPVDMEVTDPSKRTTMGGLIRDMYTGGEAFADHLGDGIRFSSDNDMTRPIMKQAELFSKRSSTYFYVFSYDGPIGFYDLSYDGAGTVGHGEELCYLFFLHDLDKYSETDKIVRERLITIWTNFAKNGYPIPLNSTLFDNVTWPKLSVDQNNFQYLDINETVEVKNFPKKDTYVKWNALYASLGRDDFDTY